ncbi:MAG: peptidoglycan DD-metalloendopeptidase family protein [Sedimentisphaerales bacterium]|nr:peptidoglycan DD-metalloendopeptidase family protein [Sedimentisphaerales bacterium]
MYKIHRFVIFLLVALLAVVTAPAGVTAAAITPLVRAVDLDVGETRQVTLHDGAQATVTLLDLTEQRDTVRSAVRRAEVSVRVNGQTAKLVSSTYHLPTTVGGVQIDCPVTGGYVSESSKGNAWGLLKAARLRLWPAGSPWIRPDTFTYPVRQRWFAGDTQMANVPCYVDACDLPGPRSIYYHYGLDFGGSEGLIEVVAATDALVVSAGDRVLDGRQDAPIEPRYDVVYLLDDRGWYYRYSHLQMIATPVIPGKRVQMGQLIGRIGKEGGSGGWSHLHFDIQSPQPSGRIGIQNGYAFIWQAYQQQYRPDIIAVARPHHLLFTGESALLDASKSWSRTGKIIRVDWTFGDGATATGATVERTYARPGEYSEIVKVTDSAGRRDYDFAVVYVIDREHPELTPPTINANYYPTFGIKAGDEITFKVRTFATQHGQETWNFGDGSVEVKTQSDGNANVHDPAGYAETRHKYEKSGDYIVSVRRTNEHGHEAVTHLHVQVN